ncbi:HK97 family phage prohead protease [Algoriphagus aquimarinus]|uniref:HK97 family phage prohead protease n=1 Tax=Algoriphagus aquimarinus TaxID=237018 RepID=UPI0030DD3D35
MNTLTIKNTKEVRLFEDIEFRAEDEDGKKYISGYALKFGMESKDLGGFREIIEPSSLDGADLSDVVALFNHNMNYVLARKNDTVDTLQLVVDETGLYYRFEVDEEISYVKDLYLNIRKGNINKSSFAFRIKEDGQTWTKRDSDYLRTITSFKGIYDVSPVTNPAYDNTDSAVRAFEEFKESNPIQTPKKEITNLNELKLKLAIA